MYLTAEKKKEFFKEYGKSEFDTGSAEGQIALFTFRIKHLTEHLNPQIVGTAKMERYHLKAVGLEPYMAKVQLAIEQLQSLKKITAAPWRRGGHGRFNSCCCRSPCDIAGGRRFVNGNEFIVPC